MKHRYVAALLALVMFGSFAVAAGSGDGAEAQTGGEPYIWEIGHVRAPEGVTRVRFHFSEDPANWTQLYFTPLGNSPVKYAFRHVDSDGTGGATGVLTFAAPIPDGGVRFSYQVVTWEP